MAAIRKVGTCECKLDTYRVRTYRNEKPGNTRGSVRTSSLGESHGWVSRQGRGCKRRAMRRWKFLEIFLRSPFFVAVVCTPLVLRRKPSRKLIPGGVLSCVLRTHTYGGMYVPVQKVCTFWTFQFWAIVSRNWPIVASFPSVLSKRGRKGQGLYYGHFSNVVHLLRRTTP